MVSHMPAAGSEVACSKQRDGSGFALRKLHQTNHIARCTCIQFLA